VQELCCCFSLNYVAKQKFSLHQLLFFTVCFIITKSSNGFNKYSVYKNPQWEKYSDFTALEKFLQFISFL